MPATSRWLKACTATPWRISSAAMSACRSEKVSTRSGSSARIFGTSARDEGRHPRLLAPHPRRPHRIARHADDAALLAEQIERLHGLFGQADDSLGREHAAQHSTTVQCAASASSNSSPPDAGDAAVLDPHHLRADALDFAGLVADIDHRHLGLVAQPRQIRQDFELARAVERGERLVEQQQPRLHQQRAADRDALALAAGQLARAGASSSAPMSSSATMRSRSAGSCGKPLIQRP